MAAARKALAYLQTGGDPKPLIDAARRLVFLKGDDAHDYKFSSAVLEDYYHASPRWRDRFLASSLMLLPGPAAHATTPWSSAPAPPSGPEPTSSLARLQMSRTRNTLCDPGETTPPGRVSDPHRRRDSSCAHLGPGLLTACCVLVLATNIAGRRGGLPSVEPEAKALLDEVAAAYQGLATYSDHGVASITATTGEGAGTPCLALSTTFQKPDRISLDAGESPAGLRRPDDHHPRRPHPEIPDRAGPERIVSSTLTEGPLGALMLGGPLGGLGELVLKLLLDDDPSSPPCSTTASACESARTASTAGQPAACWSSISAATTSRF